MNKSKNTTITLPMFLVLFFIIGNIGLSYGASPEICQQYAKTAVSQLQQARKLSMPNLQPPVWSDNYQGHYFWCTLNNETEVQKGTALRQKTIHQHLASKTQQPKQGIYQGAIPAPIPGATPVPIPGSPQQPISTSRSQTCTHYARTALDQLRQGQQLRMPGLNPPVWSDNYQGHYDWCMRVSDREVHNGTAYRQKQLDQSRQSQNNQQSGGTSQGVWPSPSSPSQGGQWTMCANEGDVCNTGGIVKEGSNKQNPQFVLRRVKYGANGKFVYADFPDEQIRCSNNTFRTDPAPGVRKQCYLAQKHAPLTTTGNWVFSANENNMIGLKTDDFLFSNFYIVRYGADGNYIYRLLDSRKKFIRCAHKSTAIMPGLDSEDPARGRSKNCYIKGVVFRQMPAYRLDASTGKVVNPDTFCANEHQECKFPGVKLVRFGIDGKFVNHVARNSWKCSCKTGPLPCLPEHDPAPSMKKHCYTVDLLGQFD